MLTVSFTDKQGDTFGKALDKRLKKFVAADAAARKAAAMTATSLSRSTWANRPDKRAAVAPRAGRTSTGGQMGSMIRWVARQGIVQLDTAKLPKHWEIQEIGTGQRATIKKGGQPNPKGRPRDGAKHVRTIKSQKGRRIKGGLVFATSGGQFAYPGTNRHQQLHLASRVSGVPGRMPGIVIQREIQGKHFVQRGGTQGFSQYQKTVLGAARQTFSKSYRP